MAVLRMYADDSASEKDQRVFAVAGYLGEASQWDKLAVEWMSVLHDPSWPTKVPEFRMADCVARGGEFRSWPRERCKDLVQRLVEVITNPSYPSLIGIGGAVVLSDFDKVTASHEDRGRGYLTGFKYAVSIALSLVDLSRDFIEFVFDEQDKFEGYACESFRELRKELPGEFQDKLFNPSFRTSKFTIQLQAADLLAWETSKHLYNCRFKPQEKRRGSLQALCCGRKHVSRCMDSRYVLSLWNKEPILPPDVYEL